MKRITLKSGKRIRLYCKCDLIKGEKRSYIQKINGLTPFTVAGTRYICHKCDMFLWAYIRK